MSYIPLRDRYQFDDATNARLETLAARAALDAERSLHADQCGCSNPACGSRVTLHAVDPTETLAYALEQGWLTLPKKDF